ncbi:MAG: esterase/lipase family protein [Pseudonocardia sp.]
MWRAAVLGLAVLLAVGCSAPPPPPAPAGAAPVIFVHGYGAGAAVFDEMIEHLRERGYPADHLLAVDLVPADGANIAVAEQVIAPAVERLAALSPDGRVDIVAHSMGALSSRWYATRLRPDRVRTLVTVVGANHGTDALCDQPTPGGADLCPAFATSGHAVQLGLNGTPATPADETPYGRSPDAAGVPRIDPQPGREIRYVAVLVPDDRWIVPNSSAGLAGADRVVTYPPEVAVTQPRPGNLLFGEPTDHDRILDDEKFLMLLDGLLDGGTTR